MTESRPEKKVGAFAVAGSIAGIPFGMPLVGIVLGAAVGAAYALYAPIRQGRNKP